MTGKSRPDPERLQPTSGRDRMTIDYPVQIIRQPDDAEPLASRTFNPAETREPHTGDALIGPTAT